MFAEGDTLFSLFLCFLEVSRDQARLTGRKRPTSSDVRLRWR